MQNVVSRQIINEGNAQLFILSFYDLHHEFFILRYSFDQRYSGRVVSLHARIRAYFKFLCHQISNIISNAASEIGYELHPVLCRKEF